MHLTMNPLDSPNPSFSYSPKTRKQRLKTSSSNISINNSNNNNNNNGQSLSQQRLKQGILRVITYNVHGWEDADNRPNLRRVVALLRELDADIIALQEVKEECEEFSSGTPEWLAKELGMDLVKIAAASPNPSMWTSELNVVLSKHPIVSKRSIKLRVDDRQERTVVGAEVEVLVGGTISKRLSFYCTHLDHALEGSRLDQLRQAFSMMIDKHRGPHILMGDFNSLCRKDYSEAQWARLNQIRKKNNWEEPLCEVYSFLASKGYRDSFWEHQSLQPQVQLQSQQQLQLPRASCWAQTRIDFIFLSQDLKARPCSYQLIEHSTKPSDHHPVMIEVQLL